jgi:hypothetical protein
MTARTTLPLVLAAALACAIAPSAHAQARPGAAQPPARPAAAQGGPALPMGRWDCRDEITGPLRTMGFFVLRPDGTYRYLDKADQQGRYRHDRATGLVEFLTGPYGKKAGSDDHFRGFLEVNSAGRPVITLRLVSKGVPYADADYCFQATR